jgi:hypothetical protein
MTLDFDFATAMDGPGLAASLGGEFRDGHLLVDSADATAISHTIEAWMTARGLPFVPVQLDERTFAFAPPAG